MNENVGCIFIGVNKCPEIINLFEKVKLYDFFLETFWYFNGDCKKIGGGIITSFHKFEGIDIMVFEVSPSPQKGIFLIENNQKVFYRRYSFGLYPFIDPEEILNYWVARKTDLIVIQDVLDRL